MIFSDPVYRWYNQIAAGKIKPILNIIYIMIP